MGSHSCPSTWAWPLPCVEAREREATHVSSTGLQEGKAFFYCSQPAVWPCGQETILFWKAKAWFKHLIIRAVAKTFDHFSSEGSNSRNCFASIFHCKGKITISDFFVCVCGTEHLRFFKNILHIFYLLCLYPTTWNIFRFFLLWIISEVLLPLFQLKRK